MSKDMLSVVDTPTRNNQKNNNIKKDRCEPLSISLPLWAIERLKKESYRSKKSRTRYIFELLLEKWGIGE